MNLNQAATGVLHVISWIIHLVFAGFAVIEVWLRHELTQLGVGREAETAVLITVAIIFFLGAIRLLGGAVQALVLLFLVLFTLQVMFTVAPV
jgi:hypothetical protein